MQLRQRRSEERASGWEGHDFTLRFSAKELEAAPTASIVTAFRRRFGRPRLALGWRASSEKDRLRHQEERHQLLQASVGWEWSSPGNGWEVADGHDRGKTFITAVRFTRGSRRNRSGSTRRKENENLGSIRT